MCQAVVCCIPQVYSWTPLHSTLVKFTWQEAGWCPFLPSLSENKWSTVCGAAIAAHRRTRRAAAAAAAAAESNEARQQAASEAAAFA